MIAAGAGLVLVGAVGTAGFFAQVAFFGATGAAPALPAENATDGKTEVTASDTPTSAELGPTASSPRAGGLDSGGTARSPELGQATGSPAASGNLDNEPTPPVAERAKDQPWSVVVIGGLALMGGGLVARRTASDRDG